MPSSLERWDGDDDLARQRRKREMRLLDQHLVDSPALTLADVVAEVLAAGDECTGGLDVPGYMASQGYGWRTVEAVVAFLHMHHPSDSLHPSQLRPL